MKNSFVVDFHSDLLSYLAVSKKRSVSDAESRCSLAQLQQGSVALQIFALYTETNRESVQRAAAQIEAFEREEAFQGRVEGFPKAFLAIENGSCFALESEPLEVAFNRLDLFLKKYRPIYISLTWNGENRFGGGCGSTQGLLPDGKSLLHFLSGRGIAIDLSHASDKLAVEILSEIDRSGLNLRVIASHSNFRQVHLQERNLPDELAIEIQRRGGVIGLNFCVPILGKEPQILLKHIEHAHRLGVERGLVFGADFFCETDFSESLVQKYGNTPLFFSELGNSSCYSWIEGVLSKSDWSQISRENGLKFLSCLSSV